MYNGEGMKISEDVQSILNAAYIDAKERGSEYITPEHVMYAAMFFDPAAEIIKRCGADSELIKKEISDHIDEAVPVLKDKEPVQTIGFQGVIERALLHSQSSQEETVHVGDDPLRDIDAARERGLGTVWVNRGGVDWPAGLQQPDRTISLISELVDEE